jgi:hypothetical protein
MSNTKRAVTAAKAANGKWASLKREAEQRASNRPARPKIEPYIIDDVEPPIVIEPPDDKRLLVISECVGSDGTFHIARVLPLLRALCGNEFPRVWMLIPDNSAEAQDLMGLLASELIQHFMGALRDAMQAADLPGNSEGSSS